MRNKKQQQLNDPEVLTHYFGNDEYKHGNKMFSADNQDESDFDGFSAEGNELDETDEETDLPDDFDD